MSIGIGGERDEEVYLVTRVVWVDSNSGIAEHGFGTRRGDDDPFICMVRHVIKLV